MGERATRTLSLLARFRDGPIALDFAAASACDVPLEALAKQPTPGVAFQPTRVRCGGTTR